MAVFRLDKFAGLARAIAPGVAYPPSVLRNLSLDVLGGYAPLGYVDEQGLGAYGVDSTVGVDQTGKSTIVISPDNSYGVLSENTIYKSGYTAESGDVATHLPSFGLYAGSAKIFGLNDIGEEVTNGTYTITAVAGSGGSLDAGNHRVTGITYARTLGGNVILGVSSTTITVSSNGSITITAPTYSKDLYTDIYIYSAPVDSAVPTFVKTLQSGGTHLVKTPPTGFSLSNAGLPVFKLAEAYKGRVFGVGVYPFVEPFSMTTLDTPYTPSLYAGGQVLVYTEVGSLNLTRTVNFIGFAATQSQSITALASGSGGLFVFLENETWFLSGVSAADFYLEPYPFTVGCDAGVTPAKLGGKVYPIWQGRIFEVSSGGARDVSAAMFRQSDPFVALSADALTGHLIAKTESGFIYRWNPLNDAWVSDLKEGASIRFYPSRTGLRYQDGARLARVLRGKPAGQVELAFHNVDCGEWQNQYGSESLGHYEKSFRRVSLLVHGEVREVLFYFSVDGKPAETYRGERGVSGRWVFSIPGTVGVYASLRFVFLDPSEDCIVRAPIEIEYESRRRER